MANGPLVKAGEQAIGRLAAEDPLERAPRDAVDRWARGQATLQEIKGYRDDELYCIAAHGYTLFLNGKVKDAQVIFEGLVAVDPRNDYYYRALGVVYHRQGDAERALRQFAHAIKVSPDSPVAYVNRAEVHISRRDHAHAIEDLEQAIRVSRDPIDPITRKASALRRLLGRR
jgi:type III secretion system low calcium response chaperone LcrH/SycD